MAGSRTRRRAGAAALVAAWAVVGLAAGWSAAADAPGRAAAAAAATSPRPAGPPAAEAAPRTPIAAAPATAPSPPTAPQATEVTAEDLQARLKQVESDAALDEAQRKALADRYRQALDQLQAARDLAAKAAQFAQALEGAPAKLEQLRAELDKPADESPVVVPPGPSSALEPDLVKAEADVAAKRRKVAELDASAKTWAERASVLPNLITEAKKRLADLSSTPAAPKTPAPAAPSAEQMAAQALLSARRKALGAEVEALEGELLGHGALTKVLAAERELAVRAAGRAEAVVKAWREAVEARRSDEARQGAAKAEQARLETLAKHPVLARLAEENAALARRRTGTGGLDARTQRTARFLESTDRLVQRLTRDLANVQSDLAVAGLTEAMGRVLREKRTELRDVRSRRKSPRARQEESSTAQLELVELRRRQTDLADGARALEEVLGPLDASMPSAERERIAEAARRLLADRATYLADLLSDYEKYTAALTQWNLKEQELAIKVDAFETFINENVLWVRSNPPVGLSDFPAAWATLREFLSPAAWTEVGRAWWADVRSAPAVHVLAAAALAALGLRRRMARRLEALGEGSIGEGGYRFANTVRAMAWTLGLSLPVPLFLAAEGWRLAAAAEGSALAGEVGFAALVVAWVALPLEFARQMVRRRGLAHRHFRWDADALAGGRRHLLGLLATAMPLLFIVAATEAKGSAHAMGPLGRLAFLALAVTCGVASQRLLRLLRRGATGAEAPGKAAQFDRVRRGAHVAAVGLWVGLAVMAAIGYYYAALELSVRVMKTLYLVLGLLVAYGLVIRGLFLARVKLAVERARKRREAQPQAPDDAPEAPPEPEVSLADLSEQGRQLLRGLAVVVLLLGLWLVWGDLLPALTFLEHYELWSLGTGDERTVVTVASLALALVLLAVTVIMARNVPALLEIVVLQHLPLDPGGRFAIRAIGRYLLTIVGVAAALGLMGIGWSKVQFVAAAITVGLGFGLQEIFANFVSGLILLLERPLRVGDVVTVGETTGTVSRIQIRATTIIDWDRKELIVPNKEFVTGRLVNWTLSDTVLRLVIPVGVAYGSDVERAKNLLLEAARRNPEVLADPAPKAFFHGFAESSLDLRLTVHVGAVTGSMAVRDALNLAIDKAFREAGIEIAFPQRDLHVRTLPDVSVVLKPGPAPPPDAAAPPPG